MLNRSVSIFVLTVVTLMPVVAVASQGHDDKAAKAREFVRTAGTGRDAKAEVKLRDGRKLRGFVEASTNDSFILIDEKLGSQTVDFDNVTDIKKPRNGMKPRTWVIIGAAAAAAVIVGVTVLYPVLCDGGAGC